jgi:hypothetical protein
LGVLYGDETKPALNYVEAYKWFRVAEIQIGRLKDKGPLAALEESISSGLVRAGDKLSPDDIARAERLAWNWRPRDQYFPGLDPFPPQ